MMDINQTRHGRSAAMMIVIVASVGLLCCYHEQNVRRHFSPSSIANPEKVHLETERRNLMLAGIDLDVDELHDLVMVKRYKTDEPSMAPSLAPASRPPLGRKQRKRQRNRRKKRNSSPSSIVPTQSLGTQAPTWVYSYMRGPEPTAEIESAAPSTLNTTSEPSMAPSLVLTTAPPTVTIGNENMSDKRNRNQVIKDQEQSISFMTEAPTFQLATETPTIGIIGTHPPTLTPRNMQPSSAPTRLTAAPSFLFDNMEGVPTTTPVKMRMRKTIAPTVRMRRRRSKTVAPTRRMRRRPPTIAPTRRKRRTITAAPTANAAAPLTLTPSSAAPTSTAPSVVPDPTQEPTVHMFTDFWPTPSPVIATELPQSEVNGNRD
ncbi:hypothetical protein MPSEU_000329900 [Mayamaea pseudoterrestris]|nr:hypothetical protein MPSEU_000329900 [Mayamaea pseudoterrestris]